MGGVRKQEPICGQKGEGPGEETNQDKQMQPNWDSSSEGKGRGALDMGEAGLPSQEGKSRKRSQSSLVTAVS